MKMLDAPLVVPSRFGQAWLLEGFRLFHRQPLVWFLTLFAYWAGLVILAMLPVIGLILPLILSPGLSFGFIALARAVDRRDLPMPLLLISGFRSAKAKPLLQLGFIYFLCLLGVLGVAWLFDGGGMVSAISDTPADLRDPEVALGASLRVGVLLALLAYIPVLMAFWYAPQLMVWKDFPAGKSLFFSFFAVWLNRWAFLRYGLAWTILIVLISLVVSFFAEIMGAEPRMIFTAVMPISLVLIAVAQGSFYASTRDVFEVRDPPEKIDTLA
jgi:hypothetical protein